MQVTEISIINHAINNNKALLPGMIAYACAETVTIANKSKTHTTKNLAIDFVTSCKQLCEKEGIDWEVIREATNNKVDDYVID